MKFFNYSGPIDPKNHYYVPHRLNEQEVRLLIEQEKYFILHAPRQSGKTTAIREFVKQLNKEILYKALYINIENAQAARSNVVLAMNAILQSFILAIQEYLPHEEEGTSTSRQCYYSQ